MFDPLLRGLVRIAFWTILQILAGFRIHHKDRVPTGGGVLLCPNHLCDADPAAIYAAVPRPAHFMAKAELFDHPVLGPLIRLCRAFPIKRDTADRSALKRAQSLLESGEMVVIFPEGGGNHEGLLQPLQSGALLIALKAKVPIVPVALVNTNGILPYGTLLPRRSHRPVEVTFGEPIDLSNLYGKRGAVDEATRRLTVRLAEMLDQPLPVGKPARHEE